MAAVGLTPAPSPSRVRGTVFRDEPGVTRDRATIRQKEPALLRMLGTELKSQC